MGGKKEKDETFDPKSEIDRTALGLLFGLRSGEISKSTPSNAISQSRRLVLGMEEFNLSSGKFLKNADDQTIRDARILQNAVKFGNDVPGTYTARTDQIGAGMDGLGSADTNRDGKLGFAEIKALLAKYANQDGSQKLSDIEAENAIRGIPLKPKPARSNEQSK